MAVGDHEALLDIARPSFEEYADRHGYDYLEAEPLDSPRPPSWHKVLVLRAALEQGYDEALWLDADCVIVDSSEDLGVPRWAWQALVEHHTGDGDVPNCGVWLVRPQMLPILTEIWAMEQHLNHGWWEQRAMHELLGYVDDRPRGGKTYRATDSDLYRCTRFLDASWNVHPWHEPVPGHPRIQHATMHPDREARMLEWASVGALACRS